MAPSLLFNAAVVLNVFGCMWSDQFQDVLGVLKFGLEPQIFCLEHREFIVLCFDHFGSLGEKDADSRIIRAFCRATKLNNWDRGVFIDVISIQNAYLHMQSIHTSVCTL